MRQIYLIHGFNVTDGGKQTIQKLEPLFKLNGFYVHTINYNWMGPIGVRFCNKKIAHTIASMADNNSIIIGHSNGCALIHHAAHYGAPFKKVVYINPALNKNASLALQVKNAQVWYSSSDNTVWKAKFMPFHIWGEMGKTGYIGLDKRYVNIDSENIFGKEIHHSDVFNDDNIEKLFKGILNFIK